MLLPDCSSVESCCLSASSISPWANKLSRFGRNAADILNSLELVQSYFFKFKKPKADTKGGDELDEYDFGEDEDDEDEPAPEDEEPAQDKEE